MLIRKLIFNIVCISIPTFSFAMHSDLHIQNNTGSYGTATLSTMLSSSPCSSHAGSEMGIIKPHEPLTIPQIAFDIFCGLLPCQAHVYATTDCSGPEVAVLSIQNGWGITGIQSQDSRYKFSGSGNNLTVDPASLNLFQRLMNIG